MLFNCIRTKASSPHKIIMSHIKTFVFFDLETTGLPSMENNKTKITELTMVAVQTEHLASGVLPRVLNKLSLCFNPQKMVSCDSERITGLSNYILENMGPFSSNTVQAINLFLDHNPKPICLVAHNGDRFDFPILKAEIKKTGISLIDDIKCVDSLIAFRDLHLEDTQIMENKIQPSTTTLSQDSPDSVPLEFQDGFDEILCKAVEDYESQIDATEEVLNKALQMQKINETTPKKPTIELTKNNSNLLLEKEVGNGDMPKRQGDSFGDVSGPSSKKPKAAASRMRLNFGLTPGLSFKLVDVYQRITNNSEVSAAHRAEGDVHMLLMCAATLGDRFITWANQNTRQFCDIPAMMPGKRIGS